MKFYKTEARDIRERRGSESVSVLMFCFELYWFVLISILFGLTKMIGFHKFLSEFSFSTYFYSSSTDTSFKNLKSLEFFQISFFYSFKNIEWWPITRFKKKYYLLFTSLSTLLIYFSIVLNSKKYESASHFTREKEKQTSKSFLKCSSEVKKIPIRHKCTCNLKEIAASANGAWCIILSPARDEQLQIVPIRHLR